MLSSAPSLCEPFMMSMHYDSADFSEGKEVRSMQTRIKLHMCKLECKLLHMFVMVIELLGYKPERAQH